jgi:hypothetical protein
MSPIVIRVLAVPDYLDISGFDGVFWTALGWDGLGFSFRVHGHEFSSFPRAVRSYATESGQSGPTLRDDNPWLPAFW